MITADESTPCLQEATEEEGQESDTEVLRVAGIVRPLRERRRQAACGRCRRGVFSVKAAAPFCHGTA